MSQNFTITPGIEQRLASWNEHLRKQKQEAAGLRPCITLSREFGCQAYPVAEALQNLFNRKKLFGGNWMVLDRKLLETIAKQSGFSETDIQHAERQNPVLHSMFSLFHDSESAEPHEVFRFIRRAVRHFAQNGNSIIVGRGGAVLTQDLENCLHLRLFASLEFRLAYCCETFGLEKEAADEYLQSQQRLRDEFLGHYTSQDPSSQEFYHLTLNNARWTPEQLALLIKQALQQTFGAD